MNEKSRESFSTNDVPRARDCDRAEDLVAYLYGEATPVESALFSRHLHTCAVCREEMTAFGAVREMVGAQRADAMSAAPSFDVAALLAPATDTLPAPVRARSAVAALREFFALSPLWLRAGAVAATLLVCALTALTLARTEVSWGADGLAFQTGVRERVVEKVVEVPVQTGFTKEQVDALVAERVNSEREKLAEELRRSVEQNSTVNVAAPFNKSVARAEKTGQRQQQRKRVSRRGSQSEDQLLAADELPRLSDLLTGAY